jgi:hypothetical protein
VGTPCDDGDACTLEDACDATGGCSGTLRDCSALDAVCVVGACDPGSGDCVAETAPDSTPCDDGDACTIDDACVDGTCSGGDGGCECGDGIVDPTEECDSGEAERRDGEACRSDCTLVECGDPTDQGRTTASSALFILKAAVGAVYCAPCVCSVNGDQAISAVDSLTALKRAVAQPVTLDCPECEAVATAWR